jgi:sugar phosphate isomerase/epimerase
MIKMRLFSLLFIYLSFAACTTHTENKSLAFSEYPNLKIGFSTQNFQKAMPVNVESLSEIIDYASKEGYDFIELRDDQASLSQDECKVLAELARKNKLDVIYEIQKNLLDTGYHDVFERGLANTLLFTGPGILRALVSKSEFELDSTKKGWNKAEMIQLRDLADSCTRVAKNNNIQFIVENLNEPFFSDSDAYLGLDSFFKNTTDTGLQFDIGNPFRNSSREKADPQKVADFLATMGNRWVTTHLKTLQKGESQPTLTSNPLEVNKVIELMAKQNVRYVTIELLPVTDKQQCFDNHAKSIQFLKEKGILKTD